MEATLKLDDQVNKIGKAVEESKPYWEARRAARQVRECELGRRFGLLGGVCFHNNSLACYPNVSHRRDKLTQ